MARAAPAGALTRYVRKYHLAPRYAREHRTTLTTADGVSLSACVIPGPPRPMCTFVLLHGFSNWSRTPAIHAFAHELATRATVIVPDLRGHGRSGGRCTLGRDEPLDVEAALGIAHPALPVVTVGVSFGGAVALLHAATYGGVAGVVAISAPAGWGGELGPGAKRIERWLSTAPGRTFVATLLRTRVAAGSDPLPEAVDVVGRIAPAFTLVVHDEGDWYFGPEHAQRIHDAAGEPKALWWVNGAGHGTDVLTRAFAARLLAEVEGRVAGASGGAAPRRRPRAPSR